MIPKNSAVDHFKEKDSRARAAAAAAVNNGQQEKKNDSDLPTATGSRIPLLFFSIWVL